MRTVITLVAGLYFGALITKSLDAPDRTEYKFIWNDDEESIPQDGGLVKIEFSEDNIIYIGPSEEYDPAQYQFFTTDDSLEVHDYSRYVGTIKLDGALKTLIDQDNQ